MAVFQQQEEVSVASELHAIVDNLQLDAPQVEPPRRPFWQRPLVWQVPLFLIVLAIVTLYNPRVDNCNGFKITYKNQILCISDDADFFLFVEHFTCDVIEKGKSIADSLKIDDAAQPKMAAYFQKYNFSVEKSPIEAEVLRGMRGVYDSTSFCKNLNRAYWNAGVRYVNLGKKDSACYYFGKLMTSKWRDSVLTNADFGAMIAQCNFIASAVKKDTATALNALNNRLLNIDNIFKRKSQQVGNIDRIAQKVPPIQQSRIKQPPIDSVSMAQSHYDSAVKSRLYSDFRTCILECKKALKLNPEKASMHNQLAECYLNDNNISYALESAKKALTYDRADMNGFINSTLAQIYGEMNDPKLFYYYTEESLKRGFPVWDYTEELGLKKYKDEAQFKALMNKYKNKTTK